MAAPVVYLPKEIKLGSTGKYIIYVKRALARAGYLTWLGPKFTPVAGPLFVKGVKRFQADNGLVQDGVYGGATHKALSTTPRQNHPGEWAFDAYSVAHLLALKPKPTTNADIVSLYFQWWDWMVANREQIHYGMGRPCLPLLHKEKPPKLPCVLDCSDTAGEYVPWLAGSIPLDPQFKFSGWGNTDSLRRGGFSITTNEISVYAPDHIVLSFYGPSWDQTKHVTAVKSASENYSNGEESAPEIWKSVTYRNDFLGLKAYPVR